MNILIHIFSGLEVIQFSLFLLQSIIVVIMLHESGHIIMIMLFNKIYNRGIFNFQLNVNLTSIEVIHKTFPNPWANILIACFGTVNPIIFSIIFYKLYFSDFWGVTMLLSIISIYNIFPFAPDGKVINYNLGKIEEIEEKR